MKLAVNICFSDEAQALPIDNCNCKANLVNHHSMTMRSKQIRKSLLTAVCLTTVLVLVCLSCAPVEGKEYHEKPKKVHIVHVPKPVFIKKPVYVHVEKKVPVVKIKPVYVPKPIIVKKIKKVPVIKKEYIIQKVKVPVIKKVPYPVPVKKIKVSLCESSSQV